jgi:23S rRNA (uracil1939-C5)-methyltransferase
MEAGALKGVISAAPHQIICVSCDPATLVREVQKLIAAGYTLVWVTPLDLFPQIYQDETVRLLMKS